MSDAIGEEELARLDTLFKERYYELHDIEAWRDAIEAAYPAIRERLRLADTLAEALETYRESFRGGDDVARLPVSIRFSDSVAARDFLERVLKAWREGGGK
jgi:hypothetical protein